MEKNKDKMLSEQIKKFNLMVDYGYYTGSLNEGFPIYKEDIPETSDDDKLLYGSELSEEDEDTIESEPSNEAPSNEEPSDEDIANELGDNLGDEQNQEGGEEMGDTLPADEPLNDETPEDLSMGEEPMDDAVELDVTDIVNSTEEIKASSDVTNDKMEQLLSMVDKLESQVASMSKISSKIDNLEMEIEKRNPTPVEKLEMRSLNSYPYNIKLTDFWKDKGLLDEPEDKEVEYVLTKDDVDNDYNEYNVKNSFDFDEEDI